MRYFLPKLCHIGIFFEGLIKNSLSFFFVKTNKLIFIFIFGNITSIKKGKLQTEIFMIMFIELFMALLSKKTLNISEKES